MDSEIKNESESRLTFLKLKSENVSLEIIPEKGGRISRYCIKKDGETFELLMPINRSQPINGESFKNLCFPLIPFSNRIRKN